MVPTFSGKGVILRLSDATPRSGFGYLSFESPCPRGNRKLFVSDRHAEGGREAAHTRQWVAGYPGTCCPTPCREGPDSAHRALPCRCACSEARIVHGPIGGLGPGPDTSRRVGRNQGFSAQDCRNAERRGRARDADHPVLTTVLCERGMRRGTAVPTRGNQRAVRRLYPATHGDVAISASNAVLLRRARDGLSHRTDAYVVPSRRPARWRLGDEHAGTGRHRTKGDGRTGDLPEGVLR